MKVNLVTCMFILDNEKNDNIRKNDMKSIKILRKKDTSLPSVEFRGNHMKSYIRDYLKNIINTDVFHLEQVFSYDYKDSIDIIYLAITNMDNVIKLDENYEIVDFQLENNKTIIFGEDHYSYITEEVLEKNNIEYLHNIKVEDDLLRKELLEILISYKRIRVNLDNTDIVFKFLSKSFTLEEVRIVYELIKGKEVDKSNFRKKIVKYCQKIDEIDSDKGYRPSQKYKFVPLKGDIWL